jgi:hypothetical protein
MRLAWRYGRARHERKSVASMTASDSIRQQDGIRLHTVGVLAEMAWARECGVKYEFTNGTYKNSHDVVDKDGAGWEVKGGCRYNYHIYFNEHSDNFVFVHISAGVGGRGVNGYEILGTMKREKLWDLCKRVGRPEYWKFGNLKGTMRGYIINWDKLSDKVDTSCLIPPWDCD